MQNRTGQGDRRVRACVRACVCVCVCVDLLLIQEHGWGTYEMGGGGEGGGVRVRGREGVCVTGVEE
ncbi:hypothetical protein HETIRDRAFT_169151 [Heterobasidion irregulare TC 32-1]|uniref:Uncharacterized protein n=1 Tax=Heterobasidion irregulare (strain TC 32-1) TaxID=747525 RepID=W4K4V6_HETIT|nr:uncharacterized protein HETIRDRAFT_169151 [Heterobasidion irregulare TC 32-1]ETW80395.1 hypothetical protein HETIRDRAFT_169151 [Heterobasidion irregulare TC 32-1]